MGYDMSLGKEDFGYTYNVSKMWYACYPDNGIREIYGMTGRQAAPVLFKLAGYMQDNKSKLLEFEPKNGWGSFDGAYEFVLKLLDSSLRQPDEFWEGD